MCLLTYVGVQCKVGRKGEDVGIFREDLDILISCTVAGTKSRKSCYILEQLSACNHKHTETLLGVLFDFMLLTETLLGI